MSYRLHHTAGSIKKRRKSSLIEGGFSAMVDGTTASFIIPYALFLGAGNFSIALFSSVPQFMGSILQLLSITAARVFTSLRNVIIASAIMQALLWTPILFLPYVVEGKERVWILLLLYSICISLTQFMTPLWRQLISGMLADHKKGSYFALRNRIGAAVNFCSLLLAGWILQLTSLSNPLLGFSFLFGMAFVARLCSACFYTAFEKNTHRLIQRNAEKFSGNFYKQTKRFLRTDAGKFVLTISFFRISVALSGPFFIVYELSHLGFNYGQFTTLIMIEVAASILFLGVWGKFNDEFGSRRVLLTAGFFVPLIPLGYLIASSYTSIIFVTFFSGIIWSGFNLAIGTYLIDVAHPYERVKTTALFQLFHGTAIFIGATIGGLFLSLLPHTKESLFVLFFISALSRCAMALFVLPRLAEPRIVEVSLGKAFASFPLRIKPTQRFVEDPYDYFLAYDDQKRKKKERLAVERAHVLQLLFPAEKA